jgi:hypothetical protein
MFYVCSNLFDCTGEAGDMHNRTVSPGYMCSAHPARWRMLSCVLVMCSVSPVLVSGTFLKPGCIAREEYHY